MSSEKLDWFPWFPKAYTSDRKLRGWKPEHHGVYLLLLMYEWMDGPLPTATSELADMVGYGLVDFRRVWRTVGRRFRKTKDGLINAKLESIRASQHGKIEAAQRGGKKGAAKRWGTHDHPMTTPSLVESKNREGIQDGVLENRPVLDHPVSDISAAHAATADDLADCWASECPDLEQPRRPLARGIRAKLTAAVKREPDMGAWLERFKRVRESDFLSGRTTDFRAAITWAIGPENTAKIDAGQYVNHTRTAPEVRKTANMAQADAALEKFTSRPMLPEITEEPTPW